uniref:NADP-dependent oxidoreductase domain-containing protein n=1 Tax=Plectus sambesii TaxID=2011161 RepID=A0A914X9N0_9BILA
MTIVGGTHKLNTGYEIPLIGFGTFQIKGQEAINVSIDAALGAGYRLIDTAKVYGNEKEIGNALQEYLPKRNLKRADLFITSKVLPIIGDNIKATREAVEESLKFLQTDYIDLVLVHYPGNFKPEAPKDDNPNNPTYRKDTFQVLEKLQAEGKIRSIGISNYEIRHIDELKKYAKIQPAVNQCEFHPHFTRNELREYCKKENIFFQAFTSLGRNDPSLINDPVVVSLAEKHKTSVYLVLLAYALVQNIGILPKSVTPARIQENFGVINVTLTKEEVEQLTGLNRNKNHSLVQGWTVT